MHPDRVQPGTGEGKAGGDGRMGLWGHGESASQRRIRSTDAIRAPCLDLLRRAGRWFPHPVKAGSTAESGPGRIFLQSADAPLGIQDLFVQGADLPAQVLALFRTLRLLELVLGRAYLDLRAVDLPPFLTNLIPQQKLQNAIEGQVKGLLT